MSEDPGSTSFEIAVVAQDPAWRAAEPDAEALARRAARAVLEHGAIRPRIGVAAEVAVVLTDDATMRTLNRTYRHQDQATNVLSFAGGDEPGGEARPRLLGDVIVARETVTREAGEQGKSVAEHLSHLVVHGVLHLLGYDHHDDPAAREMESLETAILAGIGIADPYDGVHNGIDEYERNHG